MKSHLRLTLQNLTEMVENYKEVEALALSKLRMISFILLKRVVGLMHYAPTFVKIFIIKNVLQSQTTSP